MGGEFLSKKRKNREKKKKQSQMEKQKDNTNVYKEILSYAIILVLAIKIISIIWRLLLPGWNHHFIEGI